MNAKKAVVTKLKIGRTNVVSLHSIWGATGKIESDLSFTLSSKLNLYTSSTQQKDTLRMFLQDKESGLEKRFTPQAEIYPVQIDLD